MAVMVTVTKYIPRKSQSKRPIITYSDPISVIAVTISPTIDRTAPKYVSTSKPVSDVTISSVLARIS